MVVEDMHTKTEEAMTKLLKHLFDTFVVSIDQMKVVIHFSFAARVTGKFILLLNRGLNGSMTACQILPLMYRLLIPFSRDLSSCQGKSLIASSKKAYDKRGLLIRKAGYIDDETVRKLPNRGRKRFVSEGDGGKLKVDINW